MVSDVHTVLPSEIAELDFLSHDDRLCLNKLVHNILHDNVVLFAGAGLSFNAMCRDGRGNSMVGWPKLAEKLAAALRTNEEHDILKIADYYEAKYDRAGLVDSVVTAVRDEDHIPGRVHRLLVELNFREIITTNFDTLIERTLRDLHITPQVVVYDSDLVRRRRHPRIIKMNGCLNVNPTKIVITGNDFLAYAEHHPLIEIFVTKSFVESTVLFIGFSLGDPAFRAINERVMRTLGADCRQAYSFQFGVSKEEREHWLRRKVQVIDFCADLVHDSGKELESDDREERMFRVLDALTRIRRQMSPLKSQHFRLAVAEEQGTDIDQLIEKLRPGTRISAREKAEHTAQMCWSVCLSLTHTDAKSRRVIWQRIHKWITKDLLFDGLAVKDISKRPRFLTFCSIFAPLPWIRSLTKSWIGLEDEHRLVGREFPIFVPTPDEYRVPLLGFCGTLQQNPDFYIRAADSLWKRQLEVDEPTSERTNARREIAYRFRYLMWAARERLGDWPTAHLQLERLQKVLSRLFLEDGPKAPDTSEAIRTLLDELTLGWVFGSQELPESLSRAWAAARRDVVERHPDAVPWEILIILTLMIDDTSLTEKRLTLVRHAWHQQLLDVDFLIEYLDLRLADGGFQTWEASAGSGNATAYGDLPYEQYELRVANFVGWIGYLLTTEAQKNGTRLLFVEKLEEPLLSWAAARRFPTLHKLLLKAISTMSCLDSENLDPKLKAWMRANLSRGKEGLNELAILLPEDGQWLVDEARFREMLTSLSKEPKWRVSFRVRNWLLHWSSRGVFKERTLKLISEIFAGSLMEESRSGSLGWLSLAAGIQADPTLRQHVESRLRNGRPKRPESLFHFIKSALGPILDELRKRFEASATSGEVKADGSGETHPEDYNSKLASYHQYFAPFAEDIDEEFLDQVLGPVDAKNTYTREGTVKLLAALLLHSQESLREERSQGWQKDLEQMIAHGATGEGALGPLAGTLSTEARETLQDNLVAVAVHRADRDDVHPVRWIVATLVQASPGGLPALEEGLVELVASPSLQVAEESLAAVLGSVRERFPDFLERHRRRLRRVKAVVERRGGYRETSRFAERIEELRGLL